MPLFDNTRALYEVSLALTFPVKPYTVHSVITLQADLGNIRPVSDTQQR